MIGCCETGNQQIFLYTIEYAEEAQESSQGGTEGNDYYFEFERSWVSSKCVNSCKHSSVEELWIGRSRWDAGTNSSARIPRTSIAPKSIKSRRCASFRLCNPASEKKINITVQMVAASNIHRQCSILHSGFLPQGSFIAAHIALIQRLLHSNGSQTSTNRGKEACACVYVPAFPRLIAVRLLHCARCRSAYCAACIAASHACLPPSYHSELKAALPSIMFQTRGIDVPFMESYMEYCRYLRSDRTSTSFFWSLG